MSRLITSAVLFALLCSLSLGAPVPKRPPVEVPKLTADKMHATWAYEWGGFSHGIICFDKDGTYTAQHVPGSDTVYHGTWVVEDNAVTIQECTYSVVNGFTGGPTEYRFTFAAKDYPKLSGLSNGTTKVSLKNPSR